MDMHKSIDIKSPLIKQELLFALAAIVNFL